MYTYKSVDFDPFGDNSHQTASKGNTLLDYFDVQVMEHATQVALSFYLEKITYQEINEKANQLAHLLIAEGLGSGDSVGVILNRTPKLIISLLAILKCGGTFVPIDPDFPSDRILYMLEDSAVKLILTSKEFKNKFSSATTEISIDEVWRTLGNFSNQSPDIKVDANIVAYILYTSGSTGKPKGVQIRHFNLLNFLLSMQQAPGIHANDKMLASTTISFDISLLEIFLPLISGAQIVLIDEEIKKDNKRLLNCIKLEEVTIIQGGPALFSIMLYDWKQRLPIKVLCGGEPLSKDLAKKLLSQCGELWNMYGPTETTVWSTVKKISLDDESITIGRPIANTQVYILDEKLELVPDGQPGEIYIAGDGLALGYLNRPELTSEKFIPNPFSKGNHQFIYGTGDLGIRMTNDEFQCLGRLDHQIKINGVRIELGEIEQALNKKEGVQEAIVVVREESAEIKNLCAYIIADNQWDEKTKDINAIKWREALKDELPVTMIPRDFVFLTAFPLTPNGKIDRKSLPQPISKRSALATLYSSPSTEIEKKLAALWGSTLRIDRVGIDDNFFDVGGDSLLAVKSVTDLQSQYGYDVSITKLYQCPTIKDLARLIETDEKRNETKRIKSALKTSIGEEMNERPVIQRREMDIAVVAMTGRFPKASNVDELWELLKAGEEGISFFSPDELDASIPEEEKNDPDYVSARGILAGVEDFEPSFFGINPRLAELMDPQQRIFLEICWEALEESGYTDQRYSGNIGVFGGCSNESYFLSNVQHHKRLISNIGAFQVKVVNEKDYLSSRVSYAMNLKGPAVTVQSACSTSLLAVAQAVESLRSGQCDMALAGGVSIFSPIKSGHIYQEGSMQSADGHCKPFDAEATGTIFSDGAGVVLLKPLTNAQRDGDTIYAVVKGIGVNNDGAGKGSFTAPSSDGQAKVISMALEDAQFDPKTISFVEAHGTATPLGDPIELEGLKQAFDIQEPRQYCAIGSVKSNIGHLNTAAGIAGFIKACLAIHHKQIPATIHYTRPNPHIHFEDSPFYVNEVLRNWTLNPNSDTRRAGVSSFGVGGTNVHIVLEEVETIAPAKFEEKPFTLINWSAKSETSRDLYADKLLSYLESNPTVQPVDLAYSLQNTRSDFHFRKFLIAASRENLLQQLRERGNEAQSNELKETIQEVVFMFPGQGSQYLSMGKELYASELIFKSAVDECALLLEEYLQEDIRSIIFPVQENEESQSKLNNTYYTQPALFVIEYAVAKLMMSWGIQPAVFIGHSIGEFVAAHLAGVFSLQDALFLISSRGKLMANLPRGNMLAIRSMHEKINAMLPSSGLSMAAINSPGLCVVAGASAEVAEFTRLLESQMIASTHLHTSHAFHSAMMDEIVAPYEAIVRSISLQKPIIPIVSTVTGTWMTDEEAQDPNYWASHLRNTVNFMKASATLFNDKKRFMLECGPRNVLSSLLKQQGNKGILSCPTLYNQNGQSENHGIQHALGQLWLNGIDRDWSLYYTQAKAPKIKLPSYAFNRKRYWLEPLLPEPVQTEVAIENQIL